MYKENRKMIRKTILDYTTSKKLLADKINLNTIKKTYKLIRKSKELKDLNVTDVVGYHRIMNTKIQVIYNEMRKEHTKSVNISISNKDMKVQDAFKLAIHLMEKDFKVLLSERFFDEYKKYKNYGKNDTEDIILGNLKKTIELRKKIIDAYLSFVYDLYKRIPEIIREYRKEVTK